ncbi:polysaccharide biosynthesis tyrosine autokinase [Microbacterium sp. ProA8]|uniref:polysaccharide biosynthesis tyrosine autokinase n=1 Tax=Microbacterium chionoecetis TaxID=3153754 RepID=UPI003263BAB4
MELRDYMRGLRRHWLAIVLITAVGLATGYVWTLLQTPVYEGSASGLLKTTTSASLEGLSSTSAEDSAARAKVATFLDLAQSELVAQGAIDELGLNTTPAAVINRITVSNPTSTSILKVNAQAATPAEASDLSSAWIASLAVVADDVLGDGSDGSSVVTVVAYDAAGQPTRPIFPDVNTAVVVGGVLGFGFGVAFALVRTVSDRRIRINDDIEARVGAPVVGTIPVADGLTRESRIVAHAEPNAKGNRFAVSEAFRSLRTNLQFMDVDDPPRTIVVTSPLPGDGKSMVAANIAVALAESGRPVVLVDGDLRRSTVAKTFGLPDGAGLTDVLAGRADLIDVMHRTPVSGHLVVLTAGSVPPNPSEVLGSAKMRAVLSDLAQHAMVIIDAPPLLPVTDSAVLAHQADGAILVVGLGKTTYDLVTTAEDALAKASGRLLGIVLNRVPLKGADASPYYDYRTGYGGSRSRGGADAAAAASAAQTPATEAGPARPASKKRSASAKSAASAASPRDADASTPASADTASQDFASFIAGIDGTPQDEPRRRAGRS